LDWNPNFKFHFILHINSPNDLLVLPNNLNCRSVNPKMLSSFCFFLMTVSSCISLTQTATLVCHSCHCINCFSLYFLSFSPGSWKILSDWRLFPMHTYLRNSNECSFMKLSSSLLLEFFNKKIWIMKCAQVCSCLKSFWIILFLSFLNCLVNYPQSSSNTFYSTGSRCIIMFNNILK